MSVPGSSRCCGLRLRGYLKRVQIRTNVPRRCNYLLTGSGETILDILGLEAMNAWFVVMIIRSGSTRRPCTGTTAARPDLDHDRLVRAGRASARLQGRAPVRLDRDDIGRMKISRALIWAFRVALVLLWLALSLKYWMIAGVLSPVVLALTLWLWVQAERDVRGRS
jgi:hypothetical protein